MIPRDKKRNKRNNKRKKTRLRSLTPDCPPAFCHVTSKTIEPRKNIRKTNSKILYLKHSPVDFLPVKVVSS